MCKKNRVYATVDKYPYGWILFYPQQGDTQSKHLLNSKCQGLHSSCSGFHLRRPDARNLVHFFRPLIRKHGVSLLLSVAHVNNHHGGNEKESAKSATQANRQGIINPM